MDVSPLFPGTTSPAGLFVLLDAHSYSWDEALSRIIFEVAGYKGSEWTFAENNRLLPILQPQIGVNLSWMGKRMGRPIIKIDWDQFDKLCQIQATQAEIADFLKCSVDTIDRACRREHKMSFAELYKIKAVTGRISIRRTMMQMAVKGDRHSPNILMYLDRKYLGGLPDEKAIEPAQIAANQTIQIVDSSRATVDLLREVLGKPKLVTSGEENE